MNPIFAFAIVMSAVYQVSVFAAGLILGNQIAWKLAIITMASCYISALLQTRMDANLPPGIPRAWAQVGLLDLSLVLLSIVLGAAAGIALMLG